MDSKGDVLEMLRREQGPISGERLARRLGISRNSVWKAVNKLRQEGYSISAVTNKGYELIGDGEKLTPEAIASYMKWKERPVKILVEDTVTSTNTMLKKLAEQGEKEATVLVASHQTHGKGRLGRVFYSPKDTGVYLSILVRPVFPAEEALLMTTAAAVAAAGTVEEVTGLPAKIKWVNDVYLRGKKVCGILTEASIDFESGGLHYAVVGTGVNLQIPEGGFSPELQQVAGALFQQAPPPGMAARIAAGIIDRFMEYYSHLLEKPFMKEYQERSLLTGLEITYVKGNETGEGTVVGIDDNARLLVKIPDGTVVPFSAGEVNIKKDFLKKIQEEGESTYGNEISE